MEKYYQVKIKNFAYRVKTLHFFITVTPLPILTLRDGFEFVFLLTAESKFSLVLPYLLIIFTLVSFS